MDLAFNFNLFLYVEEINRRFGPDYISVVQEPVDVCAFRCDEYTPTHRWTFFTDGGHSFEVTLDHPRMRFIVHQLAPGEVVLGKNIDVRLTVQENIVEVFHRLKERNKLSASVSDPLGLV